MTLVLYQMHLAYRFGTELFGILVSPYCIWSRGALIFLVCWSVPTVYGIGWPDLFGVLVRP